MWPWSNFKPRTDFHNFDLLPCTIEASGEVRVGERTSEAKAIIYTDGSFMDVRAGWSFVVMLMSEEGELKVLGACHVLLFIELSVVASAAVIHAAP